MPEDVLQNLVMDHHHRRPDRGAPLGFVNFTGSVRGGREMERAAAGTFTAVGTELGGKDPAYVRADADLDAAVAGLIDGAMYNSGQCCCGIERIYVHASLHDEFVDRAVALAQDYRLGNPLDPETTLGPMAQRRFADVVRDQVAEAVHAGATAHVRPFAADDGGAYLTPQILTGVSHAPWRSCATKASARWWGSCRFATMTRRSR